MDKKKPINSAALPSCIECTYFLILTARIQKNTQHTAPTAKNSTEGAIITLLSLASIGGIVNYQSIKVKV